jgi:hypothetical protein
MSFGDIKAEEVIHVLENLDPHRHDHFSLGAKPSRLVDTRVTIFSKKEKWAIVFERLGCMPGAGKLYLELYYYGNCIDRSARIDGNCILIDLLTPDQVDLFTEGEFMRPTDEVLHTRGAVVPLFYQREVYTEFKFPLKDEKRISFAEALRFAVIGHPAVFRATKEELYQCLPPDLEKKLVLDEWYHRDYYIIPTKSEILKKIPGAIASLDRKMQEQLLKDDEEIEKGNLFRAEFHRPGAYETWNMIANVIETGDANAYRPTLKPNTHWSNWEE